ncbi:MAG TPA: hypothetical protein VF765_31105 [Polyangiaceae bacterium]
MPDIVRINHTNLSWTSLVFKIDNQPWQGIVSLDYEQKRERKVVYASRQDGRPLGKTSGKYSVPSFTMKMLKDSALALKAYLSIKGLGSYGDAEFGMQIQATEPVLGVLPITISAETCTIDGDKDGYEEGIDELLTEFTIGCLQLTENGLRLWSVVRGLTAF